MGSHSLFYIHTPLELQFKLYTVKGMALFLACFINKIGNSLYLVHELKVTDKNQVDGCVEMLEERE